MGTGPSLGKFLKSMDDDELAKLMETAYKLEPQRLDKMFALAKTRYYEGSNSGQQPPRDANTVDDAAALSIPAVLLPPHSVISSSAVPPALSEMLPSSSAAATPSLSDVVPSATATEVMVIAAESTVAHSVLGGSKDPMNALWTFEGHHLREMQTADKNPHNVNQQPLHSGHLGKNGGGLDPSTGAMATRELDADGYPVMYGSCGREKRYGRCSVCYFRGLRCNTAHYCACCQRAVCIRPRKYPGEEHPKICWNVLHVDKEMIQRVERKKKRKLQALTAAAASTSVHASAARLKNVETCNTGGGATHSDRSNDNLNQSTELHRAPSIPTVVADVSGAVDL